MGKSIHINTKLIIPIVLVIAIVILFSILFYFEARMWDRVIIPFVITGFIATGMYYILNRFFEDKFISKIFLISILLHLAFILFWQLLKYYGLGLQMPTEYTFESFISDNDGILFHGLGVHVNQHLDFSILRQKIGVGGFFPKLIGMVYHFSGTNNPFLICCINSLCAGFIAPLIYYIGKITFKDISFAKLYSFFFIISFSHLMNTSTLMRDVYITLFMYLSIFLSYQFYKTRNPIFLIATLTSLYCLKAFRPYACYVVFISIIAAYVVHNIKIIKQNTKIKVNKITLLLTVLFPILLIILYLIFRKLTHAYGVITSAEDLINIRDASYTGSSSDYTFDFSAVYAIFPPIAIFLGLCCMFFAPFPWEWILVRRIIYVPDMLMLYCFLPSFFKNLKLVFNERNYILTVFLFTLCIQFSIYCITLGNSGAIHRLRGPYLPVIYLIAMYSPNKFLNKLLKLVKKLKLL